MDVILIRSDQRWMGMSIELMEDKNAIPGGIIMVYIIYISLYLYIGHMHVHVPSSFAYEHF